MGRASKATIRARVEAVAQVILDGALPFQIRQWVSEREAAGEAPWTIPEGGEPLSERQIQRYCDRADALNAAEFRTKRTRLLRRHLAKRRAIYARCVNAGDYRSALAALDSEAKLLALSGGEQARAGAQVVTGTADVVKLLAARLDQIDCSSLPVSEKAKLTATLADALLRAVSVESLDRRLEAIEAVLKAREGKA